MVTTYETGAIAAGEGSLLSRGRLWKNAAKTPVLYCHSATADALQPNDVSTVTNSKVRDIVCCLAERGLATISNDQGGTSNWGADPAPARVDGALTRINGVLGTRTDRVLLLGVSMGSVVALNWARANPSKVAAVACLLPVVNLQQIHDSGPAPIPANIESAYGGLAAYQAALPARNPAANGSAYVGMPIRLWYTTDDTTALPTEVTSFASASGATALSMGTGGHAIPSTLPAAKVADWLAGYA